MEYKVAKESMYNPVKVFFVLLFGYQDVLFKQNNCKKIKLFSNVHFAAADACLSICSLIFLLLFWSSLKALFRLGTRKYTKNRRISACFCFPFSHGLFANLIVLFCLKRTLSTRCIFLVTHFIICQHKQFTT